MRLAPLLLALLALACARPAAAPGPAPTPLPPAGGGVAAAEDDLAARIRERIAREAPAEVAVALVDLATGRRLGVHDDVSMHAASTMKVPVLLELFRQAAAGRFSLDDSVVVRNRFTSIADGTPYTLTAEEDSEAALYTMIGGKTTRRDLAERMITRSSNLATNIVIDEVGAERVRQTMESLGAGGMRVLRGVEDDAAYRLGMNNTTTAGAFARALEAIARCEAGPRFATPASAALALAPEACAEMSAILARQHFTKMIPAGLPAGIRVANKTGWISGIHHDGAIVYPPGRPPYVLVVLTRGIEESETAARVAADLSRLVWDALAGGRAAAR